MTDSKPALPSRPWRSPRARGIWTLALAATHIIVALISISSTQAEVCLLERIGDGEFISEAEAVSNDNRQAIIGLFYFVVYVGLIISFLMWLYRASKNLASLGVDQWFSPGWSVGWWFVPIACLWQPFRVVSEIWTKSHPEDNSRPAMLWVWWITWLASSWIATASVRIFLRNSDGDSIEDWILADRLSIVSDVLYLPAALLLIWVVWQITNNQIRKRRQLEARKELLAGGYVT